MSIYRIADLNIKIENNYNYTSVLCKDYLVSDEDYQIIATPDKNDIEKDRSLSPNARDEYLESLSIYRSISNQLIDYDGFILHAAVVEKDGVAYAFSAKSGTGKTTHIKLWTECFPDARIINGDKPLIRFYENTPYIYGTPWCGKEKFNINTKAPLKALCFIERAKENSIDVLPKKDAVARIFNQLLIPTNPSRLNKLLDLVDRLIESVPTYLLKCNMELSAAEVAYEAMKK